MGGLWWISRRHCREHVNNKLIEFHLSNTSVSRRARTRIVRLVDRDANDCAISPPPQWCKAWLYNTQYLKSILLWLEVCRTQGKHGWAEINEVECHMWLYWDRGKAFYFVHIKWWITVSEMGIYIDEINVYAIQNNKDLGAAHGTQNRRHILIF